ncbi:hypothetical protein MA16_Dca024697 [Dendrobium catenatum]|uniref:Uncharacterized protein n=1 Tax=Dendrobium catenatum TaxID=906689 RepID=A0A2I0VG70_9ASPA|nr:hypothetical protein MA16_Dca024697 [Dendrobium catenatum]
MCILLEIQIELIRCNLLTVAFITVLWVWDSEAQSSRASTNLARQFDSFLQDYAYRAFIHPCTKIPYDGVLPSNFIGVKIAVIMLRSGSLRTRGFHSYKELDIPTGVIAQPYVKRLGFIYQNLGNLSSLGHLQFIFHSKMQ